MKVDKVRAHREELKRLWFSIPHDENRTPKYTITVTFDKYPPREGQGTVEISRDDKEGWSSFKTHTNEPLKYALDRMNAPYNRKQYEERYDLSKYQLIIK